MKKLQIFALLFASFLSTASNAQLGGMLRDLKNLADQAKQGQSGQSNSINSTTTSSANAAANANAKNLLITYCERINSSQFANKIIELNKQIGEAQGPSTLDNYFSESELKIRNWVSQKIESNFNLKVGSGYPKSDRRIGMLIDTVNKCFTDNTDKSINSLAKLWWGYEKISQPLSPSNIGGDYVSINLNTKQSLILFTYFFEEADTFLSSLQPDPIAKMNDELKQRNESNARLKSEDIARKKEQDQKADEERKIKSLLDAAQAYLQTPDGKLVWAYQHFQIVQLCYDLRKDFAVKYIGASDYSDYRTKIKALETKLKPNLAQKNVDILYSTAEERNRNYQPFYPILLDKTNGIDLIKHITDYSKSSEWLTAKKDCDAFTSRFRTIAETNLGPEAVKKNF